MLTSGGAGEVAESAGSDRDGWWRTAARSPAWTEAWDTSSHLGFIDIYVHQSENNYLCENLNNLKSQNVIMTRLQPSPSHDMCLIYIMVYLPRK